MYILFNGICFIVDVGMIGLYNFVIGVNFEEVYCYMCFEEKVFFIILNNLS